MFIRHVPIRSRQSYPQVFVKFARFFAFGSLDSVSQAKLVAKAAAFAWSASQFRKKLLRLFSVWEKLVRAEHFFQDVSSLVLLSGANERLR